MKRQEGLAKLQKWAFLVTTMNLEMMVTNIYSGGSDNNNNVYSDKRHMIQLKIWNWTYIG